MSTSGSDHEKNSLSKMKYKIIEIKSLRTQNPIHQISTPTHNCLIITQKRVHDKRKRDCDLHRQTVRVQLKVFFFSLLLCGFSSLGFLLVWRYKSKTTLSFFLSRVAPQENKSSPFVLFAMVTSIVRLTKFSRII